MTQINKMETTSKQPEISTMMHEEVEEMQHDISKLQGLGSGTSHWTSTTSPPTLKE